MGEETGRPRVTTATGRGPAGTGEFLVGRRTRPDGTVAATRVFAVLGLPVVPLGTLVLRPEGGLPAPLEPAERRYEILDVLPLSTGAWLKSLAGAVAVLLAVAAPAALTVRLLDVGSQVMGALRLVGSALLPVLVAGALDLSVERVLKVEGKGTS